MVFLNENKIRGSDNFSCSLNILEDCWKNLQKNRENGDLGKTELLKVKLFQHCIYFLKYSGCKFETPMCFLNWCKGFWEKISVSNKQNKNKNREDKGS